MIYRVGTNDVPTLPILERRDTHPTAQCLMLFYGAKKQQVFVCVTLGTAYNDGSASL